MSAKLVAVGQSAQQVSEQEPAPDSSAKKAPYSSGLKLLVQCGISFSIGITARHLLDGQGAMAATTAVMGLPATLYWMHMRRANRRHEQAQAQLPSLDEAREQRRQSTLAQGAVDNTSRPRSP